jgi:REP element-mobilizing transposase RayT
MSPFDPNRDRRPRDWVEIHLVAAAGCPRRVLSRRAAELLEERLVLACAQSGAYVEEFLCRFDHICLIVDQPRWKRMAPLVRRLRAAARHFLRLQPMFASHRKARLLVWTVPARAEDRPARGFPGMPILAAAT